MDNIIPIRPNASGAQVPPTPSKSPRRRRAPAVSKRAMELAIDDQRIKLWEVGSIVESVALALEAHFSRDWPADIPHFPMALRLAGRMINDVTGELELPTIEERAGQIIAEKRNDL